MTLAELFRSEVVTCEPTDTIYTAMERMAHDDTGCVVVVDKRREVVGILTDRDVAKAVIVGNVDKRAAVQEIMTKDVETIWDDQGIFNATQYFSNYKIRRLPIINRDEELVGIVTVDDLLALFGREILNVSKAVVPSLANKLAVT